MLQTDWGPLGSTSLDSSTSPEQNIVLSYFFKHCFEHCLRFLLVLAAFVLERFVDPLQAHLGALEATLAL